jgi:hypothetical protein
MGGVFFLKRELIKVISVTVGSIIFVLMIPILFIIYSNLTVIP